MAGPTFPVFSYPPNWSANVVETLSWLTDVLESKTGFEQRRSLLRAPRKQIEFQGLHNAAERASLDNDLTGFGTHDWLLPSWWDQHAPEVDVAQGSNFILCRSAQYGGFIAGRYLLIRTGKKQFEVAQIFGVNENGIFLTSGLSSAWSTYARIYPLQRARFDGQPQLSRFSDQTVRSSFRFKITDNDPLASAPYLLASAKSLILNGLVARKYAVEQDGSIFAPESGVSIGQAAMMRACFTAHAGLMASQDAEAADAAGGYLALGTRLLDAFAGTGRADGAMIRRPVPTGSSEFVLPHWLYAARGNVSDLADVGQGYELVPTPKRLRASFASADGAAFRDFDIAIRYAALNDVRGEAIRAKWTALGESILWTHIQNRRLNDGRDVLERWPGLPVVVPVGAEPQTLYCFSTHARGQAPNILGVNAGNIGYNFLSRDTNGDIIFDVPDSYDVTQDTIVKPTSTPPENNGQPPETIDTNIYVKVLRATTYGRSKGDKWRGTENYQSPDASLLVEFAISRPFEPDEQITFNLGSGSSVWSAIIDANVGVVARGSVNGFYIPRGNFKLNGAAIPVNQSIDRFFITIVAKSAYKFRLGRMRLVADVNREQDVQPYFPGADSYRISGYNDLALPMGYEGSPWIGGQTVDIWPRMVGRTRGAFDNYTAANVPIFNQGSRQTVFPFSQVNSLGYTKTPEALLAEQAVAFLRAAQETYKAHAGAASIGPFAHTFVMNRPESSEFGNVLPNSWLYQNIRSDRDIFWQLRAVEGLAAMIRLALSVGKRVTFNGKPVTHGGKQLYVVMNGADAAIGFEASRAWVDAIEAARQSAFSFITWLNTNWRQRGTIVHGGKQITHGGKPITYYVSSDDTSLADFPRFVDDPRTTTPDFVPNVYAAALYMRSCFYMLQTDIDNAPTYRFIVFKCWNYLERFWQTEGEMKGTWARNPSEMSWRHAEIITTLGEMLKAPTFIPETVPHALVAQRLAAALTWLEAPGSQIGLSIPGLDQTYRGRPVLTRSPNEGGSMSVDLLRLTEEFDNRLSVPLQSEYSPDVYNRPQHSWWIRGKVKYNEFRQMLYALRGRAIPFWKPTFSADMLMTGDLAPDEIMMRVANVGYTRNGGPRRTRQHLMFAMRDGTFAFREIVGSVDVSDEAELVTLSSGFRLGVKTEDVLRISFLDLVRMDQDGFQLNHDSDTDGVTTATTVMKSVKAA